MAKKVVKKGKKQRKNKPTGKKYLKYKIEGDKITKGKFCPRCGPGVFLSVSQERTYCGRCYYSEFESRKGKKEAENQKQEA